VNSSPYLTELTPAHQSIFIGSHMSPTFKDVAYGSEISLRHEKTGCYLYSRNAHLPSGSGQQQVTCSKAFGKNNTFMILHSLETVDGKQVDERFTGFEILKNGDKIRLEHVVTKLKLHSHYVRPSFTDDKDINEVSGYGAENFAGDSNDNWKIELFEDVWGVVMSKVSRLRIKHIQTGCYLMSKESKLPEWGQGHQELACSKVAKWPLTMYMMIKLDGLLNRMNILTVALTNSVPADALKMEYPAPSIYQRFDEIHEAMKRLNKKKEKVSNVPHSSHPIEWLVNQSGIPMWSSNTSVIQLVANPTNMIVLTISLVFYVVFRVIEALMNQRGQSSFRVKSFRLMESSFFIFSGWLLHYLPFFFLDRQMFYDEYHNALIFGVLLVGHLVEMLTKKSNLALIGMFALVGVGFLKNVALTFGLELQNFP
jgi:dolichyl-phosphate-mannose-protein mannosyltransferase